MSELDKAGPSPSANRGAADAGTPTIGLNIELPLEQAPNPYITPKLCFQFHYFAIRKCTFSCATTRWWPFPAASEPAAPGEKRQP